MARDFPDTEALMRRTTRRWTMALCVTCALGPALASAQPQRPSTAAWTGVESALGRPGAPQPGGVMKVGFPRSDLSVTIGDVTLKPALALGGWVAFRMIGGKEAMAMGDLVLTLDEVNPVMTALQAGGVEPTALHNHLLGESPRIMYMHIAARGDPVAIAKTIHDALAKSATPLGTPGPSATLSAADLDTAGIDRALGAAGHLNGTVLQFGFPRPEHITMMGQEVPPSMGTATAINFQPTGGGKAAVTGDFVLRGSEVSGVVRALHAHGISVTALHSHMIGEEPRLFFMHFWANDDAVALARGLRAALDVVGSHP
jgi:Domain of Unknown Function (DUF1259)